MNSVVPFAANSIDAAAFGAALGVRLGAHVLVHLTPVGARSSLWANSPKYLCCDRGAFTGQLPDAVTAPVGGGPSASVINQLPLWVGSEPPSRKAAVVRWRVGGANG